MRAVKGSLGHSSIERCRELEGLVRRVNARINQAALEKEVGDWEEARREGQYGDSRTTMKGKAKQRLRCFPSLIVCTLTLLTDARSLAPSA
jgi:hypothetical protein